MQRASLLVCTLLLLITSSAYASPGGTDGNGGHRDSKTGEYHYHHGYPAHQHINGVCPYDPNFASSVIAGDDACTSRKVEAEEDKGDFAIKGSSPRIAQPFQGIPERGEKKRIISAAVLAIIAIGGLLSTIKRSPNNKPRE